MLINDIEMVIPDTYEKEKWETNKEKPKEPQRVIEIVKQADEQEQARELSPAEKIELKYAHMYETLD